MDQSQKWVVKKEISVGDIIKSIIIVTAFFAWGVTVETRLEKQNGINAVTAQQFLTLQAENKHSREVVEATRLEIRSGFDRLYDRLDKKVDK